ncbi:prefoldin subunit 5-like [Octopus vulgaris]|uniref:Prefoldin subunit 5-like n=3 Tax=Octopus TaxID=6643 RepID=A0AA36AQX9_OCTVU|nr:prefoldin subunit 5 [Octopus bimaculoides]XP_029635532.1 prefoldin subunit 5 [Octopus sinensis]CAI9720676.1 prefoldin subunit 5-like [Octopus vulgaris]|eukprot:XP_014785898.1 PREDICTED: prefoldin subunit 5-like [Octopus bimaculoides]
MSTQRQVDISTLPLPQLNQLSQQLDQEIEFLTLSLNQLKVAQTKFSESQECLSQVTKQNLDNDILVPLTGSMYVPGKLSNVEECLVDIGTGYYIEMTVDSSKKFFKRKVDYITKQIEKMQPLLQDKYRMKQVVMELLQMKVQAQLAAQQAPSTVNS